MKTQGMNHQLAALRASAGREAYAYFMEQGTGKTWTGLAEAERLYAAGKIDALVVIAPKGVHTNWVRREIPTHLDVLYVAHAWRSGAGKRERERMEEELLHARQRGDIPKLRIFSINIDAVVTKEGGGFLRRFVMATQAMCILDESSRIKNPAAARTKAILDLRDWFPYRRIASGTPITNAPTDVFAQMEFLESGLLGTTSYRAFVAEYAELLPPGHPMMQAMARRSPRSGQAQVIARNPDGSPRWKNLQRLNKLLEPHSFRVLKRDCLDLPEKIYKTVSFELTPNQRRAYELMRKDFRMEVGGEVLSVDKLASLNKLQQITSGYVLKPDGGVEFLPGESQRLGALLELDEDITGKYIVWARFREELRAIAAALRAAGRVVVEYHGGVGDKDREAAVDRFQNGDAEVFVGQAQSGGIGLTLTAAEQVVYFSNDYNLETRLQSEDRAHRIGTRKNVVYTDLIAEDTIDAKITLALQRKESLAAAILGDETRDNQGSLSPERKFA
jgi:SNF2 family DNA or RNA helicase